MDAGIYKVTIGNSLSQINFSLMIFLFCCQTIKNPALDRVTLQIGYGVRIISYAFSASDKL
jgi:hypothetical protein